MNINTPKSFNKNTLGDKKVADAIEPFLDYVNQNFDQFGRALQNQLTLGENLKGEVKTIQCMHNQAVTVRPGSPVAYVMPIYCVGDAVKALYTAFNADGSLSVRIKFDSPVPIQAKAQTGGGGFFTYQARNIGGIAIGDLVTFSGFGNKGNNLTGQVFGLSNTNNSPAISVLNFSDPAAGAVETLPDFVGDSEPFKTVTLLLLYA